MTSRNAYRNGMGWMVTKIGAAPCSAETRWTLSSRLVACLIALLIGLVIAPQASVGQEPAAESEPNEIGDAHTIIVTPRRPQPPAFLYAANVAAKAQVTATDVSQTIDLNIRVVQGTGGTVTLGLQGSGEVVEVAGATIAAWAVRWQDGQRFLDLRLRSEDQPISEKPGVEPSIGDATHRATIQTRSPHADLPTTVELLHLAPGKSLGFNATLEIAYSPTVARTVLAAEGFAPLAGSDRIDRLQTATGGRLSIRLERHSALPPPLELVDMALTGRVDQDGKAVEFRLSGIANVTEAGAQLPVLAGQATIAELPTGDGMRLELVHQPEQPIYRIVFQRSGQFTLDLNFVAPFVTDSAGRFSMDFTVAAGAVMPLVLTGLDPNLEFLRTAETIVPQRFDDQWRGFLPADGRVRLMLQSQRETGEAKLFFTSDATIETTVGPGLLRQEHQLEFKVLQGELPALAIDLHGPGEILSVASPRVVAWQVDGDGDQRQLRVTLNEPLTGSSRITIRSQTPLAPFPVRIEGLRLRPQGAIRHSGHLRIVNDGSVSIAPAGLRGLAQLAPAQFPGSPVDARQVFVYRFPAADYEFSVVADRVQPEVSVSHLVLYQLSESDRVITAEIELDIREATIREWNVGLPADYSVVSLTGAAVNDYIVAAEPTDSYRNAKVLFSQDVQGRQLITLQLEKSEAATAGPWALPPLAFPDAKAVRGDIGVVAAAGFRLTVAASDLLVEKPLASFPRPMPGLQQAFRIRQSDWSATMQIEALDRSVHADILHLYSLAQGTIYGNTLINYFVTGSPVAELRIDVPAELGNLTVDGQDIRTWRRDGDTVIVSLHQPVMGAYTLLVTFEQKPNPADGSFQAALVAPRDVQGDRGFIEIVSPVQVELETQIASPQLLPLDPLELPAEFRLLSTAPTLGTWQYTQRPFELRLRIGWFQPGTTAGQVVEFSEANSRVSPDGELVTDVVYYVKSRGQRTLRLQLPAEPVRLWAVSVDGRPVTARQAGGETLIPLPGGSDPNAPTEVSLRLGKPAVDSRHASLMLPIVFAPVLKTVWNASGDENHTLLPTGGTVQPARPILWPTGFDWLVQWALVPMGVIVALLVVARIVSCGGWIARGVAVCLAALAMLIAAGTGVLALKSLAPPAPLQLSLPVLAAGEAVVLEVQNLPSWQVAISWTGVSLVFAGILTCLITGLRKSSRLRSAGCGIGMLLIAVGVLWQSGGAAIFLGLLTLAILCLQVVPLGRAICVDCGAYWRQRRTANQPDPSAIPAGETAGGTSVVTSSSLLLVVCLAATVGSGAEPAWGQDSRSPAALNISTLPSTSTDQDQVRVADSLLQQWTVNSRQARLTAQATMTLTGRPGDRFVLLVAPAVLTQFDGPELRLSKWDSPQHGLVYLVTIPARASGEPDVGSDREAVNTSDDPLPASDDAAQPDDAEQAFGQYTCRFEYVCDGIKPTNGIPLLAGAAALQRIDLRHDQPSWEVVCTGAARIQPINTPEDDSAEVPENDATPADMTWTGVQLLLGPGPMNIVLRPKVRDLSAEQTEFFVEAATLYTTGPGVVDGRHRFNVRTSQGRVQTLNVNIPAGLTVSQVAGPVSSWQFDADQGRLHMQVDPATEPDFTITMDTQRSLDPLPTSIALSPPRVVGAGSDVGLIALAFGTDAQPEGVRATGLSPVNLSDFDSGLATDPQAVLHRVYRYGAEEGSLSVQVAPVAPEVRVTSKQVLSFGDERVVLSINLVVEITRTGLFQLTFPLPPGLEVESLSGESLQHWSEITELDQRQIVLQLQGKTMGTQRFALTLAGPTPIDTQEWSVPRLEINEAARQMGELVVQPVTGIRLRTTNRQNISEADPRSLGATGQGALAFRLLQRDWTLALAIEKLEPWVTGQLLNEVTLREGQTRSTLMADFQIQNAAIRTLAVRLPLMDADEMRTVRASGEPVSDFVRSNTDGNLWELRFKRRVIGAVQFQIEYERRGERSEDTERLTPIDFPEARQLAHYFAVRAGGRLEIEPQNLSGGWQSVDWSSVPASLREAGNRNAPALSLRAITPETPLPLRVIRHGLADALKLRVAQGVLTTVLSPTGDQLTAVNVTVEVIQRSSLTVGLPDGGELFSIFVNGESVHSTRHADRNAWQFYILPGMDDRTAEVRLVYLLRSDSLKHLSLVSPQLNVPLENMQWNVLAPPGFELTDNQGNMELVSTVSRESYDRQSYLSIIDTKRQAKAKQATQLLEKANELLQAGQQDKALWAFNSVANQYALDAASNEDARVQLENLQTQQAIVGLNTRRQRLFLDNRGSEPLVNNDEAWMQAAAGNPILQQETATFRPQQLSQLLAGNTQEDNAVLQQIAGRLVQHQRTTELAPQAIVITLPEEGTSYTFRRAVQVTENAPLELALTFRSQYQLRPWQWIMAGGWLLVVAVTFLRFSPTKRALADASQQ